MLSKKYPHLPKGDGPDRHFDWRLDSLPLGHGAWRRALEQLIHRDVAHGLVTQLRKVELPPSPEVFHPFLKRAASSEPPITAEARPAHDRIRLEEPDLATEAIERAEVRVSLPVMTGHWSAERTAVKRLNRA